MSRDIQFSLNKNNERDIMLASEVEAYRIKKLGEYWVLHQSDNFVALIEAMQPRQQSLFAIDCATHALHYVPFRGHPLARKAATFIGAYQQLLDKKITKEQFDSLKLPYQSAMLKGYTAGELDPYTPAAIFIMEFRPKLLALGTAHWGAEAASHWDQSSQEQQWQLDRALWYLLGLG